MGILATLCYAGYALYTLDATNYESDDDQDEYFEEMKANAKTDTQRAAITADKRRKDILKQIKYEQQR